MSALGRLRTRDQRDRTFAFPYQLISGKIFSTLFASPYIETVSTIPIQSSAEPKN